MCGMIFVYVVSDLLNSRIVVSFCKGQDECCNYVTVSRVTIILHTG